MIEIEQKIRNIVIFIIFFGSFYLECTVLAEYILYNNIGWAISGLLFICLGAGHALLWWLLIKMFPVNGG